MLKFFRICSQENKRLVIVSTILFAVVVFTGSWNCDDAYHGFVTIRNFANGHGLVYNIGERVNACTCPLFIIILGLFYFLFGHLTILSYIVCTIYSTVAFYLLINKICKEKWQIVFSFVILGTSYCFMSFTTSGLENSLLFLLEVIFIVFYTKKEQYTFWDLLILAFIDSLILFTRMDAGILFFIPTAYVYLFKRKECSFFKMALAGLIGLFPWGGVWEVFSVFYYGSFVPNTYYVKLGTSYPLMEYIQHGSKYLLMSLGYDIPLVFFIFIAVILLLKAKDFRYKVFGVGLILKLFWIIYMGGDFMVGRHFTDLFWVSICWIMVISRNENKCIVKTMPFRKAISVVGVTSILLTIQTRQFVYDTFMWPVDGVSCGDEKGYYYSTFGMMPRAYQYTKKGIDTTDLRWSNAEVIDSLNRGEKGTIFSWAPGALVYKYNDRIYMNDPYGLGDALISKLPSIKTNPWRVGHTTREIPEGYKESLNTGTNMIKDPSLHQYYDILLLVTRGKLWSVDRIKAAVNMAFGKYDYLVDEYVKHETVYNIWEENTDYVEGDSFSVDISGDHKLSEQFFVEEKYRITELTLRTFTWDSIYSDDAVININILDEKEHMISHTEFAASGLKNNGLAEIHMNDTIVCKGAYKLEISTSNVEFPLGISASKDAKQSTYDYNGLSMEGAGIQYIMKGKKVYEYNRMEKKV